MKKVLTVILDLDGVLITTPPWKKDDLDSDGYSMFNTACVDRFNKLLNSLESYIWLSSTRRSNKTLEEFNSIFQHRNIHTPISGFLPIEEKPCSRKEEIIRFIETNKLSSYLIIDDDKSLNDLNENMKNRLVQTEFLKGFDQNALKKALEIIS
jgi:hypothetical protein